MLKSILLIQLIKSINQITQNKSEKKKENFVLAHKFIHGAQKVEHFTDNIIFNDGLSIRPGRLLDHSL